MEDVVSGLKWPWILAATYAIGGCLCLVAIVYQLTGQAFGMSLPGFSLACFLGCGLLSFLTKGLSMREGVLASSLIGVAQLFFGTGGVIGHVDVIELQATLGHPVSTAMVSLAGAVLGGRLGAQLSAFSRPLLDRMGGVGLAALILVGACFVHAILIAIVEVVAPRLVVASWLFAVVTTPSLAAAALQQTRDKPAEQSLAAGITAMIVVFDALFLWKGYGLGLMCLSTLVLIFLGAAVYALALPGLMTVQAFSSWRRVDPQLPYAIAMKGREAPPPD